MNIYVISTHTPYIDLQTDWPMMCPSDEFWNPYSEVNAQLSTYFQVMVF